MKPTLNALGKICFHGKFEGNEISGGSIIKAKYSIPDVLNMDSEEEQAKLLEKIEYNRRLERAAEDFDDTDEDRRSGVTIAATSVHISGNVYGRDGKS